MATGRPGVGYPRGQKYDGLATRLISFRKMGIRLFVIPPRSPKLNGHVERALRTHTEEFYEVYDGDLDMGPLNQALRNWEEVYNTVRPHQSLGYLTPLQFLHHQYKSNKGLMCH